MNFIIYMKVCVKEVDEIKLLCKKKFIMNINNQFLIKYNIKNKIFMGFWKYFFFIIYCLYDVIIYRMVRKDQ